MGIYKNVMEMLVEEEVVRQVKGLPTRTASYINQVELVAYALNQLPALYATSEKGLEHQLKRGREKYKAQIAQAVQRSIAAVGRDPLRVCVPLPDQQSVPLREVLHQMRLLLKNDKVSWENLPTMVEQALVRTSQKRASQDSQATQSMPYTGWRRPSTHAPSAPKSASGSPSAHSTPRSAHYAPNDSPDEPSGWDNPLYHSR
ncbi:MAG: hypothetical protein Kow00121_11000 [Elainellaceae cyanobacterium]